MKRLTQDRPVNWRARIGPALAALGGAALIAAGPARAESRSFDLPVFTEIEASRGVMLIFEIGPTQSIEVEGDAEDFDRLYVEVEDGKLEIRTRGIMLFGNNPRFRARVTAPALEALAANTGAEARATGVEAERFRVAASTGGEVEISGACGALEADVSTGGEIEAAEFHCRDADVNASTGGEISLFASESLDADASTGGQIDVYGQPGEVDRDRSTGGAINIRS